jgi:lipopolysaccharide/colanic/teichoic acid biosynthesis glycosyltransferase
MVADLYIGGSSFRYATFERADIARYGDVEPERRLVKLGESTGIEMDEQPLAYPLGSAEAVGGERDNAGQPTDLVYAPALAPDRLICLTPPDVRVPGFYERCVKRVLDILICVVVSVLALPLLALISLALYVTMGPPVTFRQRRVGRNGEVFTILKFRTMLPDRRKNQSSDYRGPERRQRHKAPDDPRLTPLGRFLRKWSLDELPQLVNVLRGEMTLVGPRPELVEIVLNYQPWQHRRHTVKPGVTGLWQISGHRDGLMHEHVELDLEYIDQMSFKTDMKIMVRTIGAVLRTSLGC